MIYFTEFKKEIREIFERYIETIESVQAKSKETKLKGMTPYETVPGDNFLKELTPDEKTAFNEEIQPLKDRGQLLVNNLLEQIEAERTKAPSTDAVNYVSMLKLIKNVTEDEIKQALNIYGGTYIVYEAIAQIAIDNNIYIGDNNDGAWRLDDFEETLESVAKYIRSMNALNAQKQTRGQIEFFLMNIDNTLPDEY